MKSLNTDLPFKVGERAIAVLKGLPMWQCENCSEYLLEDLVMGRVEEIIARIDAATELAVLLYSA